VAGGLSSRLLLRLFSSVENIRHTLGVHSTMLQTLTRRQKSADGLAITQIPDGMSFPMQTYDDIDNAESKLSDAAMKSVLVSSACSFCCFTLNRMPFELSGRCAVLLSLQILVTST
jgi:hypothetical protein